MGLFWPDKNFGCYGNIFSIDLQWEKWKLTFFPVSVGIFGLFFYKNIE